MAYKARNPKLRHYLKNNANAVVKYESNVGDRQCRLSISIGGEVIASATAYDKFAAEQRLADLLK